MAPSTRRYRPVPVRGQARALRWRHDLTVKITEKHHGLDQVQQQQDKSNAQKAPSAPPPALFSRIMPGAGRVVGRQFDGVQRQGRGRQQHIHRQHDGDRDRRVAQRQPAGFRREAGIGRRGAGVRAYFRASSTRVSSMRANTVESSKIADARIEYKSSVIRWRRSWAGWRVSSSMFAILRPLAEA